MVIEKVPFRKYHLKDKDQEVFPVKMNEEEMNWLMDGAIRIRQTKKSTTIKQLAEIGYAKVLQDQKIIEISVNNIRKNKRTGIDEFEQDIIKSWQK